MTLKEARQLAKVFPERYRLEAKMVRGTDQKPALFMYRVFETKDLSAPQVIFDSGPVGRTGNTVVRGYPMFGTVFNHAMEWLLW